MREARLGIVRMRPIRNRRDEAMKERLVRDIMKRSDEDRAGRQCREGESKGKAGIVRMRPIRNKKR